MATPVPPHHTPEYLAANKGPTVLGVIIALPALATIVVCLRMYTRIRIVKNPSWDDWAIVVALINAIACAICQGFQVKNGMGRHMDTLSMQQGINSLKALFASTIVYKASLFCIKSSIVLQYLRITVDPRVRLACYLLFGFVTASFIQALTTSIWTCNPVPKFWDDRIKGTCINKPALWFANAGISIFADIWLIILPFFILQKMILRTREKVTLILILGLGGFASVASVLRLYYIYLVSISHDITWDNPGTAMWSTIELTIGIVCGSLPTLRALFARFFPRVFKSSLNTGPKRGYHGQVSGPRVRTDDEFHADEDQDNILVKTDIALEETYKYPLSSSSSERAPERPW